MRTRRARIVTDQTLPTVSVTTQISRAMYDEVVAILGPLTMSAYLRELIQDHLEAQHKVP